MMSRINSILAASVFVLVTGCASIDYDYPRSESFHETDTADTFLGQQILPVVATKPEGHSGFYPMGDGVDALAARILLAQRA